MSRRILGGVVATLALVSIVLGSGAARAATDLQAIILDPPAPGFEVAGPDYEGYNGPVTIEGEPRPENYEAPPLARFVQGWSKDYVKNTEHAFEFVTITILEMRSAAAAAANTTATRKAEELPAGSRQFDAGIPGSLAVAWDEPYEGSKVVRQNVAFTHGPFMVVVATEGLDEGLAPQTVVAIAKAQYATVQDVVRTLPPDTPAEIDEVEPENRFETMAERGGYLAGSLFVPLLVVIVIMIVISKRKAKPTVWSGGMYASAGDVMPGGAAPPPPMPPMPPTTSAPSPDWAPPAAPVMTPAPAPAPSSATSTIAPPAPPVAVAPHHAEMQECPNCHNAFGNGTECATCQAARTMCVVCGTRIWAGAMTCSAHSGQVR